MNSLNIFPVNISRTDRTLVVILTIISLFGSLAMFSPDSPFNNRILTLFYVIFSYLGSLYVLAHVIGREHTKNERLVVLSIAFYWIIYFFNRYSLSKVSPQPLLLLTITSFALLDEELKALVFKLYRIVIVLISFLGIFSYIAYFFHLGIPYEMVNYYGNNETVMYINYHFAYIHANVWDMSLRLCGLYNEPGFLGTFCALALIADRMNFHKVGNWAILIAGVLSLSLAFFVIVAVGLLAYLIKSRRNRVLFVLVVLLSIYIFPHVVSTIQFENPAVEKFIARFDPDNEHSGTKRTNEAFDEVYDQFLNGPVVEVLFGRGTGSLSVIKDSGYATYKSYILQYGFIGAFFLWSFLLYVGLRHTEHNKNSLIYLLCFFISIIQRPHVFTFVYYLMLFGGCIYCRNLDDTQQIIESK